MSVHATELVHNCTGYSGYSADILTTTEHFGHSWWHRRGLVEPVKIFPSSN